jgi:hypothetical protein
MITCAGAEKGTQDGTYRHKTLEGDERGLKVWTNTNSSNDLEYDDLGPGSVDVKIDEESKAQCHQDHTRPNHRQILPSLLYKDTGEGGKER